MTQVPLKALKGFTRLFLKAGEHRTLKFSLSPDDLAVTNVDGRLVELKGQMIISIGGSQPNEKNNTSGNILKQKVTLL